MLKEFRWLLFVPAALTLGNLLCGLAVLALIYFADVTLAVTYGWILVCLGAVFDGFDGWAARRLNVSTKFGAWLDTLADVTTFGFAPAGLVLFTAGDLAFTGLAAMVGVCGFYLLAMGWRLWRHLRMQAVSKPRRYVGLPSPAAGVTVMVMLAVAGSASAGIAMLLLAMAMVSRFVWSLPCPKLHGATISSA